MNEFDVSGITLTELDKKIILSVQDGLEITRRPYLKIAASLNISEEEVVKSLNKIKASGFIRKNALATNHYKLGYKYNAMTVWQIPNDEIQTVGNLFKKFKFISHCYERPQYFPIWEYNLFAMIHGKSLDEIECKVDQMKKAIDGMFIKNELLFSTEILKKTGIRLKEGKHV